MTKYAPTVNPGDTRVRIDYFVGNNALGSTPSIAFQEEEIIRLTDGSEKRIATGRSVTVTYTPGKAVPLRNPDSDELIGADTNHDAIFAGLYALARQAQTEADAPPTVDQPTEPEITTQEEPTDGPQA